MFQKPSARILRLFETTAKSVPACYNLPIVVQARKPEVRMALAAGTGLVPRLRWPLAAASLAIAFVLFFGAPLPSREKIWSIGIYGGPSPLTLSPATSVHNPILTARQVTDVRAAFVADPFLVRDGSAWCLFFEVLTLPSRRGEIGLATSSDGTHWE